MECINNQDMRVVYGDATLGVHGCYEEPLCSGNGCSKKEFHYIFSYAAGGMESMVINEREWLYRSPKPAFWRAVTDNDRGNKFPIKSGMWYSADMFITCREIKVCVDGKEIPLPCAPENNKYKGTETAERMEILYTYETITMPKTQVQVSYEVNMTGEIRVKVHYFGQKGLPQLPVFGMRFIMPTCADGYIYEGLSGETYPDRMAGGVPGIYEVEGLPVTPYLVPQDCGMHMNTKWVEIVRSTSLDNSHKDKKAEKLRFVLDNLAFSCLPYTAQELENATHQEELPPARRTVLCVCGAVRGVGGIDSWGSDVEPAYHINAEEDIQFSFRINI